MATGEARPHCAQCNKVFGRVQELKRHMRDKHMDRGRCPFRLFNWTRPDKIKAHIVTHHAERFTAEILEGVKGLCGQNVIKLVDAYDYASELPMAS